MRSAFRSLCLAILIFKSRDFINIRKDKPRRDPTTDIKPPDKSDISVEIPMVFLPSDGKIRQAGLEQDTIYADSKSMVTAKEFEIGI